MPHTRSAKKRLRQSTKRRLHNRAVVRAIKAGLKDVTVAAQAGNVEQLQAAAKAVIKRLDKAAAKRVLHPNAAARKKGQVARLVHQKLASKGP
jgi:small subunit ribosomal protein S20